MVNVCGKVVGESEVQCVYVVWYETEARVIVDDGRTAATTRMMSVLTAAKC